MGREQVEYLRHFISPSPTRFRRATCLRRGSPRPRPARRFEVGPPLRATAHLSSAHHTAALRLQRVLEPPAAHEACTLPLSHHLPLVRLRHQLVAPRPLLRTKPSPSLALALPAFPLPPPVRRPRGWASMVFLAHQRRATSLAGHLIFVRPVQVLLPLIESDLLLSALLQLVLRPERPSSSSSIAKRDQAATRLDLRLLNPSSHTATINPSPLTRTRRQLLRRKKASARRPTAARVPTLPPRPRLRLAPNFFRPQQLVSQSFAPCRTAPMVLVPPVRPRTAPCPLLATPEATQLIEAGSLVPQLPAESSLPRGLSPDRY